MSTRLLSSQKHPQLPGQRDHEQISLTAVMRYILVGIPPVPALLYNNEDVYIYAYMHVLTFINTPFPTDCCLKKHPDFFGKTQIFSSSNHHLFKQNIDIFFKSTLFEDCEGNAC